MAISRPSSFVMGARDGLALRSAIGSVAGEVAAKAPCTMTVMRNRDTLVCPQQAEYPGAKD